MRAHRAHRIEEAAAVTPRTPQSRTRSRRLLSLSINLTVNRRPTSCDTGTRTFAVRVRAIVTRAAGGPTHALQRERDRRTKDAYDRLLPNPSNQSGTLIRAVSAPSSPLRSEDRCGRRFTTPLRASVVPALARIRALSSRRVGGLEPRLTPLSLFERTR
jgi:hypothetical protein